MRQVRSIRSALYRQDSNGAKWPVSVNRIWEIHQAAKDVRQAGVLKL